MTQKQSNLLVEYAEKKAQAKEIATELEVMEPKVLGFLEKQGVDTLQMEESTFSVVYRKKWKYSESYRSREEQYDSILKAQRKDEEENGEATFIESKGLMFRKYQPK